MSQQDICNKCGVASPSGSRFCGSCGQTFATKQMTTMQIQHPSRQAEFVIPRQWPARVVAAAICLGAIGLTLSAWGWRDSSQTGKLLFWLTSIAAAAGSLMACKLWTNQASNRRLTTSGLGAAVMYLSLFYSGNLLLPQQHVVEVVNATEQTNNTNEQRPDSEDTNDGETGTQDVPPDNTEEVAAAETPDAGSQISPVVSSSNRPDGSEEVIEQGGDAVSELDEPIDLDIDLKETQSTELANTPTPSYGQNEAKIEEPMPLDPVGIEPPAQPMKATVSFGALRTGKVPTNAFAAAGIRVVGPQPVIQNLNLDAMVVSGRQIRVLGAAATPGEDRMSSLVLQFDRPVRSFSLTRIGVKGGGSLPKWRLEAFNRQGQLVAATGENRFAMPGQPKRFTVSAAEIASVRLTADNRFGNSTWATYSALPVVQFELDRGNSAVRTRSSSDRDIIRARELPANGNVPFEVGPDGPAIGGENFAPPSDDRVDFQRLPPVAEGAIGGESVAPPTHN